MTDDVRSAAATVSGMDARALVGSACLWAWVDALYMSAFFAPFGGRGVMSEAATWGTFLLIVPLSLAFLLCPRVARAVTQTRAGIVATGVAGAAGSLLFVLAACLAYAWLLVPASVLAALFMGSAILGWGGVYCRDGMRSATLYVAGGFACALVPDVTFLFMAPPVSALAPAALPLLASVLLLATPRELRAYCDVRLADGGAVAPGAGEGVGTSGAPGAGTPSRRGRSAFGRVRISLGISATTVCALALIMFGLGYMQHQISFSELPGFADGAAAMQVVRGLVSAALFALALLAPHVLTHAYRVGLLVIVAGFSLMPLLAGSEHLWVSGAVILAGYTTFDVLVWVVVAQAAYAGLARPERITCFMRLLVSSLFCGLGGVCGVVPGGGSEHLPFPFADAIFVGYLMTVAVVLVVGGRDVWELFDARPAPVAPAPAASLDAAVDALSRAWGLTARERQVFGYLAVGRTQPWVAETLGISESTVNSHVRHIYGKAGVNSRQELLDEVLGAQA